MPDSTRYLLSLPERATRATAAIAGGLVHEATGVLLPTSVRQSKFYQATVSRLLRLTVELLGGVKGVFPNETMSAEELLRRKAAGNVVEVAGFLAVGWSPIWLLAAASDILGGTRTYLATLVEELKQNGALPADVEISSFDELLNALEGTSGTMADTIDMLPLNVQDARESWQRLQASAAELPDAGKLAGLFGQLQTLAQRENRSLLEISSMVGLGAVRAGVQLGNTYLFSYYQQAFDTIASEGLVVYLRRVSAPYLLQAVSHFDQRQSSFTERMLERWNKPKPDTL
ncbi:MAG: hypothetical protein MUD01_07500 [Chloroflexaceae bacterium]|jgi:hypothetical protein|nr:hypothetical protein [Chloroflexaceae bacterium]